MLVVWTSRAVSADSTGKTELGTELRILSEGRSKNLIGACLIDCVSRQEKYPANIQNYSQRCMRNSGAQGHTEERISNRP